LIAPRALGVGYDVIGGLIHDDYPLRVVLVLALVKAAIWSCSAGLGHLGRACSRRLLMIGGALGALEGRVFPAAGPRRLGADQHGRRSSAGRCARR
jgi:H+/Cl- antiporter ClcA